MSITSEIERLTNAKTAIASAITAKGVTVPEGTMIEGMSALIDSIPTGVEILETDVYASNIALPYSGLKQVDIEFSSEGKTIVGFKNFSFDPAASLSYKFNIYAVGALSTDYVTMVLYGHSYMTINSLSFTVVYYNN